MDQLPVEPSEIVITASRAPGDAADTPASVSVIDEDRIGRLGEPLAVSLVRLTPSASVSTSGPAGSLTQVRIRGAEASHTLLFIDGIRANDPASVNEPQFQLLNADLLSRVEVVRGPQSALWGSEAIGGVIAVNGVDPTASSPAVSAETGSFGLWRAAASGAFISGPARAAAAVGWQQSDGIDSFGGGDRDGYRNVAARVRASWSVTNSVELGVSGLSLNGLTEFDGYDPYTFVRSHDLASRNSLHAGRIWLSTGSPASAWRATASGSVLGSLNRNYFAGDEINRTRGRRRTLAGQAEHRFSTGAISHQLIAAVDVERETFAVDDSVYGGFTTQKRNRRHQALTFEWRAEAGPLIGDIAVRHDRFNRFKDATTVRASALVAIGGGFSIAGSYGQGIAQPSFSDLYGFFPGSFVGNPSLKPESSRGVEVAARYRNDRLQASLTWYRQRLRDEIVDLFDSSTFLSTTANRERDSRRSGFEAELGHAFGRARLTAHYGYLDATEPAPVGALQVREVRRPKHSGAIALDGASGRFSYGGSIAYTGSRTDMDFDVFPARAVILRSYWLAGARVAYAVAPRIELFARAANAFDQRYQDVFGYRTEGRSLNVGIRLAARR